MSVWRRNLRRYRLTSSEASIFIGIEPLRLRYLDSSGESSEQNALAVIQRPIKSTFTRQCWREIGKFLFGVDGEC